MQDSGANDDGFTEAEYARLLALAARRYRFCDYGEETAEPLVVWRHDIDYSHNRARALARLEAEQGVSCVYHVLLTSRYYSVFEPETLEILHEIVSHGHHIGLHFDLDVFGLDQSVAEDVLLERIEFEKRTLEYLLDVSIEAMSFHNTVLNNTRVGRALTIAGMINVNADEVFESYKYVSDSLGIWRRDRLEDILTGEIHARLNVLTHPVWWTLEAMQPVERVRRAVSGRERRGLNDYFDVMDRYGRAIKVFSRADFSPAKLNETS